MSKDVFIFLLVKVWKISYQTCWVVSSQFFSWCRLSACWNKTRVELSILNRSEAKVDLVMIPTLLLFKCKLLCYHVRNKWGKNPCHEISSSQSYLSFAKSPAKLTRCNYIPQEGTRIRTFGNLWGLCLHSTLAGTPPSAGSIKIKTTMFDSLFALLFIHLIRIEEISIFLVGTSLWGPVHYSTLPTCGYYF